jgi:hypothetical protein
MSSPDYSDTAETSAPRHLRLNLETDGKRVEILQAWVVAEPAVATPRAIGPIVYEVSATGWPTRVDTLVDPLISRSAARPGTREHFIHKSETATFVIRIPLSQNQIPADFRVRILRAKRNLPLDITEIAELVRVEPHEAFDELGMIDLPTLARHAGFNQLVKEGQLSIQTKRQ